jgi:hypothetical protein
MAKRKTNGAYEHRKYRYRAFKQNTRTASCRKGADVEAAKEHA